MKKLVLLLGILLFTSGISFGSECSYQCVEPYDLNNPISTFFSKITGINFTRTKISESVLKKIISNSVKGGKLNISIDSYSGKDLANGRFKSLIITGKDVSIDGIYLSSVELKSLCEFNYLQYDKQGNVTFKEDFPMSFNIQMSSDDINKTMQSEKYQMLLKNMNKLSFAGVRIESTESSIRGNKFYYSMNIAIPFLKTQKIEIVGDLKVTDGRISLKDTRLSSNSKTMDLKKIDSIMSYINPLDFSINIFNNKNAKLHVRNVAIKNNIIIAEGIIVVPKD